MVQGTAWIITGWTVISGSVILLGFFFYYELPDPPTTPPPLNTTTFEMTTVTQLDSCGVRSSDLPNLAPALGPLISAVIDGRIIGGATAIEGDSPWMVYLYLKAAGPVNGGVCGASLLNHRWLVTAAHCIETINPALYAVVLGEHAISVTSGHEVFRDIVQIEFNNYDSIRFNNDIALLKMNEAVGFNKYIRPICVVPEGTRTDANSQPTFAGAICQTLGWGHTSSPGGTRSDVLMQLNVRILPFLLCNDITTANAFEYGSRVVSPGDPKFCAGGVLGEDSCDGDSGGPLVCLHTDGLYYLHGITSYGTNVCAQAGRPGVYTKVANESNWIAATIA